MLTLRHSGFFTTSIRTDSTEPECVPLPEHQGNGEIGLRGNLKFVVERGIETIERKELGRRAEERAGIGGGAVVKGALLTKAACRTLAATRWGGAAATRPAFGASSRSSSSATRRCKNFTSARISHRMKPSANNARNRRASVTGRGYAGFGGKSKARRNAANSKSADPLQLVS